MAAFLSIRYGGCGLAMFCVSLTFMSGFSLSAEVGVSPTAKADAPPIHGDFIYVIIGKVEAVIMVSFIGEMAGVMPLTK